MDGLFTQTLSNIRARLSGRAAQVSGLLPSGDLNALVEQVVETVDPRIRVITHYHKKLVKPTLIAWQYLTNLVQQIPDSLDVSHQTLVHDPRVKLIFSNTEVMAKIFGESAELINFLSVDNNQSLKYVYMLLCMKKGEHSILGTELHGEILEREVIKTVVSFSNHQLLSPSATKVQALDGFKHCAFESFLHIAVANTLELNYEYRQLIERKSVLQKKYGTSMTDAGAINSGIAFFANSPIVKNQEIIDIERQITQIKYDIASPEQHLEQVCDVLSHPEKNIKLRRCSLLLDKVGEKISDATSTQGIAINFAEVEVERMLNRMALMIRSPTKELMDYLRHA